ncbi:MAG: sigma-54 dependent transcriptional regulator [Planctomycetota bacterium]|nr:sigma-54 dependent transcriptional regulator [Planctomycetota bacterium]MDW8373054.1 sigma-54 dependent transcriptional regulator [Planctomycetota bacterium]
MSVVHAPVNSPDNALSTATILVVDDEPAIRLSVVRAFPGMTVREASTCQEAIERVRDAYPDVCILDQRLPDGAGLDVVARLKAIDPELPIILLTAHGSVDLAVEALKLGVADFIEKPFSLERLRTTVRNQLEKQALGRQVRKLAGRSEGRTKIIAHDPAMRRVLALVRRVAAVPSTTVLIQGESGVGKELIARAIHERSARADKAFVAINCAALSEHLLEAELFGYEKGAFTGADSKGKAGLFEVADGGTIFLDEIGEMPLELQTKLLRALQERRFRRVGGLQDIEVDVRVVAATNRDLRQEVAAGRFRQDLYFRLKVVPIHIPPLRERRDDIIPLAEHIFARLASELGRPDAVLSEAARAAMRAYDWPGNVRELANAIERALICAESTVIGPEDLVMDESLRHAPACADAVPPSASAPASAASPAAPPPGSLVLPPDLRNLAAIEALVIRATLAECGGQKSKAAERLGINRTTLYHKLREMGMEAPSSE